MQWNGKKVFVTGAGGFIGSHLCEQLVRSGAEVTALIKYSSSSSWGNLEFAPPEIKRSLKVVKGNIEDAGAMQTLLKGQEALFHLAALIAIPYSYLAPQSYVATNVAGTVNVMLAALRNDIQRVVHVSTSETYGTAIYSPIDEKHPAQGQSPYSASKIGADKMVESFHLSFQLPVVTVRPFNAYGPRQSARAIIPTIISQALSQDVIRLGSLSPTRDLTYAEDTARGMMAAAASDKAIGQVINIGNGKTITMGELANRILSLMGVHKEIVAEQQERVRPEKSEVMHLCANIDLARKILGWEPSVSLDAGLRATIGFIEKNQGLFKPEIYNV